MPLIRHLSSIHPAPGVSFHKIGLQGAGSDVSLTHSVLYESFDPVKRHCANART